MWKIRVKIGDTNITDMQLNTYTSLAVSKSEVSVSEFRHCRSAGVNNTLITPEKNLKRKFRNSTFTVTKLLPFPQICCQKWLITTSSIIHVELKQNKIHTQHVAWKKKEKKAELSPKVTDLKGYK